LNSKAGQFNIPIPVRQGIIHISAENMKPEFNWATSVQFLKTVGPARARALTRLGIDTVGHLLQHYPRRYYDRTESVTVARVVPGKEVTVLGEVLTAGERRTRRGGTIQTVTLGDPSGVLFCVWFNQRFLLKQFQPGKKVMVSGVAQRHQGKLQLTHPDFELLAAADRTDTNESGAGLHTGRLVPVYGLTAGVGQHWLRSLVWQALQRLAEAGSGAPAENLPVSILRKRDLPGLQKSLRDIHFPRDKQSLEQARRRLVYQELFNIQLLMALRRGSRQAQPGIALAQPGDLTRQLVEGLPFALTGAQRRVLKEILHDLRSGRIMHRMIQGDVGSGKTLVAFLAALFVIEQGYQAVLMAPTEVLARQHGETLRRLAGPLDVTVETLTGSTPAAERRAVLAGVASGDIDLLVGTHAVIQDDVRIPRLALSIVDEQHRFGVRQRGQSARGGEQLAQAHVLVMSATPIPRSLALTLYGDLDLSLIDELPAGRQPITTHIVREKEEAQLWEACRREMTAGRQIYVVYPVIEETEGQDLKAASTEYERLQSQVFPDRRLALLHGKLKAAEKNRIMAEFTAGQIDLLVATTVVEVGLDVPNATGMIIHNPERFGLAQLHQLRGRVGRGAHHSVCWLLCDRFVAEESFQRISFFSRNLDGFALAEEDLRLRGPGDAWGTRQHGAPGFQLANPLRDVELVRLCQIDARRLLEDDPGLTGPEGRVVRQGLENAFGSHLPGRAG
jgi:ATP-dependent DNA helicase RecG